MLAEVIKNIANTIIVAGAALGGLAVIVKAWQKSKSFDAEKIEKTVKENSDEIITLKTDVKLLKNQYKDMKEDHEKLEDGQREILGKIEQIRVDIVTIRSGS